MELYKAQTLSAELISILTPHCRRICIAGSVRRECSEVNDIDIVLIQHPYHLEQFLRFDSHRFEIGIKSAFNPNLKWGAKYKQIIFKGHKIELWIADKRNWGLIYAIRTGSAEFSQYLLSKWKTESNGGYSDQGMLRLADGTGIPVYEESQLFRLCKIDFVEPVNRSK